MTRNHRRAYNQLKALGCPVFERGDEPKGFFISAEEEASHEWADYYATHWPGWGNLNPKIGEILTPLNLFAEWENGGCLGVYEI